jgi:hypothetical protein
VYIGKMSSIYVVACNFALSLSLYWSAFIKVLLMDKQAPQFDEKVVMAYQSHDAAELEASEEQKDSRVIIML